jgi:tRNA-specific 2-thiouridylase
MVEAAGLQNFRKKDSQDICFVPDGDYAAFIEHETGKKYPEGDFVNEDGEIMGRHSGLIHYTIGQRKGLGISALPEPYYVKRKDTENNTIVLATNKELFSRELHAGEINWIVWEKLPSEIRCHAKIRYRHKEQPCTVFIDESDMSRAKVVFDEPQRAITSGQSVVFYDGDRVLGGGIIL